MFFAGSCSSTDDIFNWRGFNIVNSTSKSGNGFGYPEGCSTLAQTIPITTTISPCLVSVTVQLTLTDLYPRNQTVDIRVNIYKAQTSERKINIFWFYPWPTSVPTVQVLEPTLTSGIGTLQPWLNKPQNLTVTLSEQLKLNKSTTYVMALTTAGMQNQNRRVSLQYQTNYVENSFVGAQIFTVDSGNNSNAIFEKPWDAICYSGLAFPNGSRRCSKLLCTVHFT